VSTPEQQAFARPDPGPSVGDHVMKINLKGVPNTTNRACDTSSSNNIYTPFGTDVGGDIGSISHQHIEWLLGTTNKVVDHCTEALDTDPAQVNLDSRVAYVYTIRLLGPVSDTNNLRFCSDIIDVHNAGTHCVLGETNVLRDTGGTPQFTIPAKKIFDDANKDQVWSLVTGTDFRNAQIDIWEAP